MDLTKTLEIASCTDPGMVRSHNEDSIAADAANGLVVLADGMGGYNAGEVASGMATTVIVTEMQQILRTARPYDIDQRSNEEIATRLVREQVLKANTLDLPGRAEPAPVRRHGHHAGGRPVLRQPHAGRAPGRLAAVPAARRQLRAGDARPFAAAGADRLGPDHRRAGEEGAAQEPGHRALGIDPSVEPEIHEYPTKPGDIYLLCSDGLCDMVEDEDIGMTLQALGANLKLAAQQLVQMANDNGGRDNVSVILGARPAGVPRRPAASWPRCSRG